VRKITHPPRKFPARLADLAYRRRGLALSLGAILLVVVALALKVRQIDRRHAGES